MKKAFWIILLSISLTACATTGANNTAADVDQNIATAKQINGSATVLLNSAGPLVVSGICVVQPQDCLAAQTALKLAQGTNTEIGNLIAAAEATHQAPDSAKLSVMTASLMANIGDINKLIAAYGGQPLDVSSFNAAAAALK